MACRSSVRQKHWSVRIIPPAFTARGAPGASNPITRLPSVKNRSCAISTDCLSDSTGETLLQLLETRLDNVVYRLGFANTRSAARQLVSHGHVLVNGRRVNVASYNVKAGDEITIKDKPKSRQLALRNLDLTQIVPVPDWLTADRDGLSGKVSHIPSREEMQPIVNEQLVVELYSR
jgi:ribosomal protein S4